MTQRTPNGHARRTLSVACPAVVFVLVGIFAQDAAAIPVFARKYAKSCVTCHSTYPKLNAFGEAFRRNGYRFPAGEDEDATEQEPVAMGHAAHKKVFPKVVWPGDLPGGAPVSFQLASWISYAPDAENKVGFDQVGGNIGINIAGTLAKRFAVWAGANVRGGTGEDASAELERVFVQIKAFAEKAYLNMRVGRIEPGSVPHSTHRTLGFTPWYTTTPVQDNPNTLEPAQLGIEINGVVGNGRVGYAVGVVEGTSDTPKDVFGRVEYKLGGMRLDGIGGATTASPWRDDSLRVGTFGYLGFSELGDETASQDDTYWIVGGDVNGYWRDLNLMAAFTYGQNKTLILHGSHRDSQDMARIWPDRLRDLAVADAPVSLRTPLCGRALTQIGCPEASTP